MTVWGIDSSTQHDLSSDLHRIVSSHFDLMIRNGKTPSVFVGGEFDGVAYFPVDIAGDRYCLTATGLFAQPEGALPQPYLPQELVTSAPPLNEQTASIFTLHRLNDQELVALVLGVEPDNHAAGRIACAMGLDGWRNGVPLHEVALDCGTIGSRRLQRLEAALELGRRALAPRKHDELARAGE